MIEGRREARTVPLWRRLYGRAATWRHRLSESERHDALRVENVAGHRVLVLPRVMNPSRCRSTEVLARALGPTTVPQGCRVLDLGTGTGVLSILAARWARRAVAVDDNPEAVRCARMNVSIARLDGRIDVRQGDLFDAVRGERFDLVLMNPPYFRSVSDDLFQGQRRRTDVSERFLAGLPMHLEAEGRALVVLSRLHDSRGFLAPLDREGFRTERALEVDVLSDVFEVYRVRRPDDAAPIPATEVQ